MATIQQSIVWLNLIACMALSAGFTQQQQQQPPNLMFASNQNNHQTPLPPGQNHFRPYPDNYYNIINNITDNNRPPLWFIRRPIYLIERRLRNFWHYFINGGLINTNNNDQTKRMPM